MTSDFVLEPTVSLPLSTNPGTLANVYHAIEAYTDQTLPIVPLGDHEFLPVIHYAPPNLAPRLVKVVFPNFSDINGDCYVPLYQCCAVPGKLDTLANFSATHDAFLAHCTTRSVERLNWFLRQGAEMKILNAMEDGFVILVNMKKKSAAAADTPPR